MHSPTPAETAAILKQKLPTEIIGIICEFSDFKTHTAIRSTCSSVRLYVPLRKVVGFEEYKRLVKHYEIDCWETEKERVFQERIRLDLHHEELRQYQVEYLQKFYLKYELCRISRKLLDHPESYNGIDLLFDHCYFLAAAASVGDIDLMNRLLQVPLMNPAAYRNCAIEYVSRIGRLEIVQLLLQDPRVDPSEFSNRAIRYASRNGHVAVVQALLKDPRVDPSGKENFAIRYASRNGYLAVVQEFLKDPRVDPSDRDNEAIRSASRNGHHAVVQALLQDPRVDPSDRDNYAIRLASKNGHQVVVHALILDPRVDPSDRDNWAIRFATQNGHEDVVQALLQDPRVRLC